MLVILSIVSFRKVKVFSKIIGKCFLLVILFISSYFGLRQVFYNHNVDRGLEFHALPTKTIDIITLGSSHAQFSFDPSLIYNQTGLYSYNLGSACQPLEISKEMLKEALKTQKPKMVFLEIFTALPLQKMCHADSNYTLAAYLLRGQEKINALNYLPTQKRKLYQNDFLIYHNDWRNIDNLAYFTHFRNSTLKLEDINNSFGYLDNVPDSKIENFWPIEVKKSKYKQEISNKDLAILNDILAICKTNKIELVLYKTPIDGVDSLNQGYFDSVKRWAKQNNITVIDFLNNCLKYDFYMYIHSDSYHAYNSGASIICLELGNYINANKKVFNHQANNVLEKKYRHRSFYSVGEILKQEADFVKVLKRLKSAKGYALLTYQNSDKTVAFLEAINDYSNNQLSANNSFNALFKDRKLVGIFTNDLLYQNHSFKKEANILYIDKQKYNLKENFQIHYLDDDFRLRAQFASKSHYYIGYSGGYPYEEFIKSN